MERNKTNFFWYATPDSMMQTAHNMVAFGAENLKRAKIIQDLEPLKQILNNRENGLISPMDFNKFMHPFIFEKYTDLVKICLFFENYMKAQLISKEILIHKINKIKGCESISSQQQKRPISARELHNILPFAVDDVDGTIYHEALSNQTIGMNVMLRNKKYRDIIVLPEAIRLFVEKLTDKRNELHFISELEFEMNSSYLADLDMVNNFVNQLFKQ